MTINFTFKGKHCSINLSEEKERLIIENDSKYSYEKNGEKFISEDFFSNPKIVKDITRFYLKHNKSWKLINHKMGDTEKDLKINPSKKNIVVLLESPHKHEYSKKFHPIGPAKGTTGDNFYNYFCSHVIPILTSHGIRLDGRMRYEICFSNPVPYQSSLYEITKIEELDKTIRNTVWRELFKYCKAEFEKRIESYEPKIILNGCTSDLKDEVEEAIKSVQCEKMKVSHPSSWARGLGGFKI
jgi:hypothetical protein